MTALAYAAPTAYDDALRDSRHPGAKAAREQADWLSWLELGGTAARTLADYQWATDFLLARYPHKDFGEFTDSDLLLVLKRFPARSRRVRMAAFASWFKWGVRTRRREGNPMDLLPDIKRQPRQLVEVFSPEEVDALCALRSPDGHLMTVLFEAGLRKSEARHLVAKRCVFQQRQVLIIDGTKGGKPRAVPMSDRLLVALNDLFRLEGIEPDEYLWGHKPGGGRVQRNRPIGEGTFHRWWAKAIERAGVRYRKPHTTRHTYATTWRLRGLDLDDIQLLLGHASISTTSDLYVHRQVEDIAAKMKELT